MKPRILAIAAPVLLVAVLLGLLVRLPAPVAAAPRLQEATHAYVVLQSGAITNGNGTAVAPINAPDAYDELTVQLTGQISATVNWEATVDGSNWIALPAANVATAASATTATANGVYRMDVTGLRSVRARVSGLITNTTDTINIAGFLTAP